MIKMQYGSLSTEKEQRINLKWYKICSIDILL